MSAARPASGKRGVPVQIGGQRLVLRTDLDEAAVLEMAAFVDRRMKDVQQHTRAADTQALAILVALQVAEDLFAERRSRADLKKKIRDKGHAILQLIERTTGV